MLLDATDREAHTQTKWKMHCRCLRVSKLMLEMDFELDCLVAACGFSAHEAILLIFAQPRPRRKRHERRGLCAQCSNILAELDVRPRMLAVRVISMHPGPF